jgi:hypothetical protein
MIMAEENGINGAKMVGRHRRSGEFCRTRAPAKGIPPTRRIKDRIGQQAKRSNFEQHGRHADVGDGQSHS